MMMQIVDRGLRSIILRTIMGSFALLIGLVLPQAVHAQETVELNGHRFSVAEGHTVELAASADLVPRPIHAAFDEQGRLFVSDSSGSNAPVLEQLADPTHRILMLEDVDSDGVFDRSSVFADKLMFPEGTLWYRGSLYVAAPPQIWKLTDTNGDGRADQREVWFDGKTLTGCANDLHGPYLGRDGWIYWCKGAFAEQSYKDRQGQPWSTQAAHIFRKHPDGDRIEAVMTGGMDNPVDVVVTPEGERIFTTTFLTHPGNGKRDGLIHAIYGGVYGKEHRVLEGHVRTGPLLPPLCHLGPAAPSGLELIENAVHLTGEEDVDCLLSTSFNLHKVFWHPLRWNGAAYSTEANDLLVSDQLDFHPTDVIQAPDGSWIVVDTGGWYKLCCPTSQLVKPDVLGGIYRIRSLDESAPHDPLGLKLDWENASPTRLCQWLDDPRFRVRERSIQRLVDYGEDAIADLVAVLKSSTSITARQNSVWALCRIEGERARQAVRVALLDSEPSVAHSALHAASLHFDVEARKAIEKQLPNWPRHVQRAAMECLGRIGNREDLDTIFQLAHQVEPSSVLSHSLIYAAIEIGDVEKVTQYLKVSSPRIQRAAAIASEQLGEDDLVPKLLVPWLRRNEPELYETARWLLGRHPEWAGSLAPELGSILDAANQSEVAVRELQSWIRPFFANESVALAVDDWTAEKLQNPSQVDEASLWLDFCSPADCHPLCTKTVIRLIEGADDARLVRILKWLGQGAPTLLKRRELKQRLDALVNDSQAPLSNRMLAAAALGEESGRLPDEVFEAAIERLLQGDDSLASSIRRILRYNELSEEQAALLADSLENLPATDFESVLSSLAKLKSASLADRTRHWLEHRDAAAWLPESTIRKSLTSMGMSDETIDDAFYVDLANLRAEQSAKLVQLLAELPEGDVRRGQALFHDAKTQCIQCHQMGYVGGKRGPDLTRIGSIRQPRDLLEAIVFPSISFVQSYEPTVITTIDGETIQGLIIGETAKTLTISTDAKNQRVLAREDIEQIAPGDVSLMPSGFDQQLSSQELADLIEFLKASR